MLQTVAAVVTPLRDVETVDVDLAEITACGSSYSCAAAAALAADTMIVAANYR